MDKSEGGTVVRGLEEVKVEKGASAAKQQETAPREEKKPDGLDVSAFADDIGVKKAEGTISISFRSMRSILISWMSSCIPNVTSLPPFWIQFIAFWIPPFVPVHSSTWVNLSGAAFLICAR